MRKRFGSSRSKAVKSSSSAGRLMKSRASGREITFMRSAASCTLRVIGPATRPM